MFSRQTLFCFMIESFLTGRPRERGGMFNNQPILKPSKSAIMSRDFSGCGSGIVEVNLLAGLEDSTGEKIRKVLLEPLTGGDEQWITNVGSGWSLPMWVSRVLGEKATHGGKPLGENRAASLFTADRDLLMLYLRMLTFGQWTWGVVRCPDKQCGAGMDFTFDLATLELPTVGGFAPVHSAEVDHESRAIELHFREPDGQDQEAVAGIASTSPYHAWLTLISRCIVQWEDAPGISRERLGELPPGVKRAIDRVMADAICSIDWDIELTCPECGRGFASTLDIQALFREELRYCEEDLWEEVHQLAFYYHWFEADIFSLTRWKRKMYLGYIQKHLDSPRG